MILTYKHKYAQGKEFHLVDNQDKPNEWSII